MRTLTMSTLVLAFAASAFADPLVAKDTFSPAPPAAVTMEGRLGGKLELCVKNRLLAQDIDAVVKPYREKKEIGSGRLALRVLGQMVHLPRAGGCLPIHTRDLRQG